MPTKNIITFTVILTVQNSTECDFESGICRFMSDKARRLQWKVGRALEVKDLHKDAPHQDATTHTGMDVTAICQHKLLPTLFDTVLTDS